MVVLFTYHNCTLDEAKEEVMKVVPGLHNDITFMDTNEVDKGSIEWLEFMRLLKIHVPVMHETIQYALKEHVEYDSFIYKQYGY